MLVILNSSITIILMSINQRKQKILLPLTPLGKTMLMMGFEILSQKNDMNLVAWKKSLKITFLAILLARYFVIIFLCLLPTFSYLSLLSGFVNSALFRFSFRYDSHAACCFWFCLLPFVSLNSLQWNSCLQSRLWPHADPAMVLPL